MTPNAPAADRNGGTVKLTQGMIALFAFCCGAIVANLYYAQPITELIAPDIHMSSGTASLIVSLTQIGYAFGLFFLVPLGDLLENPGRSVKFPRVWSLQTPPSDDRRLS